VVAVYPLMKRLSPTWPNDFTLGMAFYWGALMGWAALFGQARSAGVTFLYAGSDRLGDPLLRPPSTRTRTSEDDALLA
jgi:hypothetical protein